MISCQIALQDIGVDGSVYHLILDRLDTIHWIMHGQTKIAVSNISSQMCCFTLEIHSLGNVMRL